MQLTNLPLLWLDIVIMENSEPSTYNSHSETRKNLHILLAPMRTYYFESITLFERE